MSCFINGFAFAQIAVGHNTPDIHAQLDIKAEQKGILIPRITLEDPKLPIPFDTSSSPLPESLLVYNKKNNSNTIASGYYYWQNDQWHKLITQEDINIPEKITTTHKLENNDIHKNTIKSTVNKAEASVKIISTVSNSLAPANTSGYPLTTTVNGVNSNLINIPQPWNIAGEKTKASTNTQNIYQQGNVGIGKTNMIPDAKLHVNGTVRFDNIATLKTPPYMVTMNASNELQKTEVSDIVIPKGAIIMWSGNAIPKGWTLCDGTNGTPNLQERFIVGATTSSKYPVGSIGGQEQVTLTVAQMPKHSHTFKMHNRYNSGRYGNANAPWNNVEHHDPTMENRRTAEVGSNMPHENRPPYYALYYIMKL